MARALLPLLPLVALAFGAAIHAGEADGLAAAQDPKEYAAAMKAVAAKATAKPGVYLLLGDSITYASPNTAWVRSGMAGASDAEKVFARWSHAGADDDGDGWHLASVDAPGGGRSETAAGGMRSDEFLAGGKAGLPPCARIIAKYRPHLALYMLGTNDISAGRPVAAYIADVEKAVDLLIAGGAVPIVSTLPPYRGKAAEVAAYNDALRDLAKRRKLPLIDLFAEMKARAGDELEKAYLCPDGIHLTADHAAGPPTADNLRASGYLLRCWCAVQKGMEVKAAVLDGGK